MKRLIRLVAVLASALASCQSTVAAPRNVVVIVADDMGRDTGCYGDKIARTPNIDALAREGTRFEFAFCTTASCSASRSVILTGLYNHANGHYGHQHAEHNFGALPFVRGLPVLLKQAGYRTCSIGKVHVQPEATFKFDVYTNDGAMGGRNAVKMAENAEKFIREDDSRPFFIYFCPTDPHRAAKAFDNERPHPGIKDEKFAPQEVPVPHFLPDNADARAELAEYYQAVNRVDQGVGRLMQALKATNHLDDTLVMFLSDNGIPFPNAKTTMYDSGTRLPLIVRAPGQKNRGIVTSALVNWADLTPTILDFTGAKGPDYPLQGRSFLSILDQTDPKGWDETFGSHTFHEVTMYYPMRSIRTRKYRLILNIAHPLPFPFASDLYASPTWQGVLKRGDSMYGSRSVEAYVHRPKYELYDLDSDPREVNNIADKPESARTLAELQEKLKAWQKKTKDPWLSKYEYE